MPVVFSMKDKLNVKIDLLSNKIDSVYEQRSVKHWVGEIKMGKIEHCVFRDFFSSVAFHHRNEPFLREKYEIRVLGLSRTQI